MLKRALRKIYKETIYTWNEKMHTMRFKRMTANVPVIITSNHDKNAHPST